MRKGAAFEWGPEQIAAQENLKRALASSPALCPIDYSSPAEVILAVDTSKIAIRHLLAQCNLEKPSAATLPNSGQLLSTTASSMAQTASLDDLPSLAIPQSRKMIQTGPTASTACSTSSTQQFLTSTPSHNTNLLSGDDCQPPCCHSLLTGHHLRRPTSSAGLPVPHNSLLPRRHLRASTPLLHPPCASFTSLSMVSNSSDMTHKAVTRSSSGHLSVWVSSHKPTMASNTELRLISQMPTVEMPAPLFACMHVDTMYLPKSGEVQYLLQGWCSLTSYIEAHAVRYENMHKITKWLFQDVLCRWGTLCKTVTTCDFDFKCGALVFLCNTTIKKALNRKMRLRYLRP
ncbi:hypothetical protein NUW54_g13007 [Trametes sanguinea]|uniref:Uncharacterized protein n=1 Tax=Trametes sanguinea TaxID=158606 RepID=A0ACC1MR11_9APHY|nr:hypothetical protein NUW54_g13007 [Trametes sanguinea]